jgi:hypothetical protein
MSSDDTLSPSPEAQDGAGTESGEKQEPEKPLNRAERRAQAQGKKGASETGLLAGLRQNNIQGIKGKQAGGGQKKSFQRKV